MHFTRIVLCTVTNLTSNVCNSRLLKLILFMIFILLHRYHYNVADARLHQHVEKGNEDGLHISCVASAANLWALIMDAGTGFCSQVYELSPVFLHKVWLHEKLPSPSFTMAMDLLIIFLHYFFLSFAWVVDSSSAQAFFAWLLAILSFAHEI